MDYSNFVRNLYRYATNELKKYPEYNGIIVRLNKTLDIPSEFLHSEESESMFMPQKSVNIDAPTKYFIEFMDYCVSLMPDLGLVFANKNRIMELYNLVNSLGILENDEETYEYIKFIVELGIATLEERGIL